jgi:hypothetical protein
MRIFSLEKEHKPKGAMAVEKPLSGKEGGILKTHHHQIQLSKTMCAASPH